MLGRILFLLIRQFEAPSRLLELRHQYVNEYGDVLKWHEYPVYELEPNSAVTLLETVPFSDTDVNQLDEVQQGGVASQRIELQLHRIL